MALLDRTVTLNREALCSVADRHLRHEFNVLGSGWVRVYHGMRCPGFEGHDYSAADVTLESVLPAGAAPLLELAQRYVPGYVSIDWHIDFKSGFRYPLKHHACLQYGILPGVDAKVPSDLSRGYHLVTMALAWRASGDRRYRDEVIAQILDWLALNPFEYGPAWRANMNVAIRAANWAVAYDLIGCEAGAFAEHLEASLRLHRRYIAEHLEFPEDIHHPNHYIANLAGMLVLCAFMRERDPEAQAWRCLALRELRRELDSQVLEDGFDFGASTYYHALVLEMVTYSLVLAGRADGAGDIRDWIAGHMGTGRMAKLRAMFLALRDITQPNGLIPLVGDTDSGRFLCLETPGTDNRDWRFLSGVGAALFDDAALLPEAWRPEDAIAAALLLGTAPVTPSAGPLPSTAYPAAGFYVLRGPGMHAVVSCGPIGTGGKGGHAHNDKLAFTLTLAGQEILIDPGVYVYTASRYYRNLFRSVRAHNTVAVAGEEQNRFLADSPWWGCHEDTHCRCLEWEVGPDVDIFSGEHSGYARLDSPVVHRRRVEWHKRDGKLLIHDELQGAASAVRWTFVLHPQCNVLEVQGSRALVARGELLLSFSASTGRWHCEPGFCAPAYGVLKDCSQLIVELPEGAGGNTMTIVIVQYRPSEQPVPLAGRAAREGR